MYQFKLFPDAWALANILKVIATLPGLILKINTNKLCKYLLAGESKGTLGHTDTWLWYAVAVFCYQIARYIVSMASEYVYLIC